MTAFAGEAMASTIGVGCHQIPLAELRHRNEDFAAPYQFLATDRRRSARRSLNPKSVEKLRGLGRQH